MSKLDNYAEAVAAFAEGEEIQVLHGNEWGDWNCDKPPTYDTWDDFRVRSNSMNKLKNYAEAVTAFAGGKDIQVFNVGHVWEDWDSDKPPTYSSWDDFRVKSSTTKYRIAIVDSGGIKRPCIIIEGSKDDNIPSFVRWHGDWFEV